MSDFFKNPVESNQEKIYTVTEFNTEINALLNQFTVTVQGEVSGLKVIQEKYVRFDLKDKTSLLGCFLGLRQMNVQIEDGMEIKVRGRPGLYLPQGRYTFRVDSLSPIGEGALRKSFELTKAKLSAEGLFDERHKKALPKFPQTLGLVTSVDAAAYTDVLKILNSRWSGLEIVVYNSRVQGREAVNELVKGIEYFNQYEPVDVMILTRGGGSLEDLQAFNSETLCRAVFASRIPIICGIGHERDLSLAELVADVRASTPTNAAQLAVPDKREVAGHLVSFQWQLNSLIEQMIDSRKARVANLMNQIRSLVLSQKNAFQETLHRLSLSLRQFQQGLAESLKGIYHEKQSINAAWSAISVDHWQQFKSRVTLLESLSPFKVLKRGYSVTTGLDGRIIKSLVQVRDGMNLVTRVSDGEINSKVTRQMNLKI